MPYYLTEKERKACAYFESLEYFSETQADNAVKFCCSIPGCNREEQEYLLEWVFDGYWGDLVRTGNKYGAFTQLLNFCGDCWVVHVTDSDYNEYRKCMYDSSMIGGEYMDPTGNLLVWDI